MRAIRAGTWVRLRRGEQEIPFRLPLDVHLNIEPVDVPTPEGCVAYPSEVIVNTLIIVHRAEVVDA